MHPVAPGQTSWSRVRCRRRTSRFGTASTRSTSETDLSRSWPRSPLSSFARHRAYHDGESACRSAKQRNPGALNSCSRSTPTLTRSQIHCARRHRLTSSARASLILVQSHSPPSYGNTLSFQSFASLVARGPATAESGAKGLGSPSAPRVIGWRPPSERARALSLRGEQASSVPPQRCPARCLTASCVAHSAAFSA